MGLHIIYSKTLQATKSSKKVHKKINRRKKNQSEGERKRAVDIIIITELVFCYWSLLRGLPDTQVGSHTFDKRDTVYVVYFAPPLPILGSGVEGNETPNATGGICLSAIPRGLPDRLLAGYCNTVRTLVTGSATGVTRRGKAALGGDSQR